MFQKLLYITALFTFCGCFFPNHDEGHTTKISPSFSFLMHPSGNQLMYKEDAKMNGGEVLERDIDSLGWNTNYIVIYSKGVYKAFSQSKHLPDIQVTSNRDHFFKANLISNNILHPIKYYSSAQ